MIGTSLNQWFLYNRDIRRERVKPEGMGNRGTSLTSFSNLEIWSLLQSKKICA